MRRPKTFDPLRYHADPTNNDWQSVNSKEELDDVVFRGSPPYWIGVRGASDTTLDDCSPLLDLISAHRVRGNHVQARRPDHTPVRDAARVGARCPMLFRWGLLQPAVSFGQVGCVSYSWIDGAFVRDCDQNLASVICEMR